MTDENEMMANYNESFVEDFEQVDAVNDAMAEEVETKQPWADLPTDCIYYEKMYDDGHLGSFTESPEMAYHFGWTENRIGKDEVQQSDKNGWTYVKDKCPMLSDNDIKIAENNLEIARLKHLLADSDYKAIKFAEGEITAEEYAETKVQRKAWRDEINRLEAENEDLGSQTLPF